MLHQSVKGGSLFACHQIKAGFLHLIFFKGLKSVSLNSKKEPTGP